MDFWIAGMEMEVDCWGVLRPKLDCAGWVSNESL